ncbi:hypothetical protein GCM10017687_50310 [Streptomyces echinatus]
MRTAAAAPLDVGCGCFAPTAAARNRYVTGCGPPAVLARFPAPLQGIASAARWTAAASLSFSGAAPPGNANRLRA